MIDMLVLNPFNIERLWFSNRPTYGLVLNRRWPPLTGSANKKAFIKPFTQASNSIKTADPKFLRSKKPVELIMLWGDIKTALRRGK